jgi:hypothetical protein
MTQQQTIPLRFFQDQSHAWLFVKKTFLERLGLSLNDFTSYSYQDDKAVYLEEDLDAVVFINRLEANGFKIGEVFIDEENISSIRLKDRIQTN